MFRIAGFVLLLLSGNAAAFTMPQPKAMASTTRLHMSEEGPPKFRSVLDKDIMYDERTGRFFESSQVPTECIPEDEFCVIDEDTGKMIRLTVEEKERIFLDALQSYYTSGRQVLNDEEFDLLKEDLEWLGSDMVQMNRKEVKYLTAMQDYLKGNPTMTDREFDKLKAELKEDGSKFAADAEPKCYIDTGVCKATFEVDNFRNNLLYLPAGAILTLGWLGFGFALIEPIIRINPLLLLGLGAPLIYTGTKKVTDDFIFNNSLIGYGPCPSCGSENRVYFGNILGVEGFNDVAQIKCKNCKEVLNVQRNSLRCSTVPK